MSDDCPIVNPDGLFIPESILVAMINMNYEAIGRVVYYMIEWTHHLDPICQSNIEKTSYEAALIKAVWKELLRQRHCVKGLNPDFFANRYNEDDDGE